MKGYNNAKKLLSVLLTFMLFTSFNTKAFALDGGFSDRSLDDTVYVTQEYSESDYKALSLSGEK